MDSSDSLTSASAFQQVFDTIDHIYDTSGFSQHDQLLKPVLASIKKQGPDFAADTIRYGIRQLHGLNVPDQARQVFICQELLKLVFQSPVASEEVTLMPLLTVLDSELAAYNQSFYTYLLLPLLQHVQTVAKQKPLSADFSHHLHTVTVQNVRIHQASGNEPRQANKAHTILSRLTKTKQGNYPVLLASDNDAFGRAINATVEAAAPAQRNVLYGLMARYLKAPGAKPSAKYTREVQKLYTQLGDSAVYISLVNQWLRAFNQTGIQTHMHQHRHHQDYTYTTHTFLHDSNAILAKGIIWSMVGLGEADAALLKLLNDVAEKSYRKIPGQGPAAAGVGNACLYVLAQSGMAGVGQLSRLKQRIKQANTQTLIEKHIQEASARFCSLS